jgi:hypothetical protein
VKSETQIGLNISSLFTILKLSESHADLLRLQLDEFDSTDINLTIQSTTHAREVSFILPRLKVPDEELVIPKITEIGNATLESSDFH